MKDEGYVFIPYACQKEGANCDLHVSMHGCGQGDPVTWCENEARYYGMYAASNNLIILYPMAEFCWDSKGDNFTGVDKYATKDGLQPKAIMKMIERLTTPA
jgi:poly(3-hydroxybutyrate) depolymerase